MHLIDIEDLFERAVDATEVARRVPHRRPDGEPNMTRHNADGYARALIDLVADLTGESADRVVDRVNTARQARYVVA